jgi:hypothetical protein
MGYEFVDTLPLESIKPGTNLLVTEPTVGGQHKTVLSLLSGPRSEGALFIATRETGAETISLFEGCGGQYDENRMAIIDCSEGGVAAPEHNITTLQSPGDLTGIGIGYSELYEGLYESGFERVRTGLVDLSALILYVEDFRKIHKFLHTMTGRISRAGGLGVFVIDPETQDEQTIRSLEQTFDAGIDISVLDAQAREFELETRGLPNQPQGFQSFSL